MILITVTSKKESAIQQISEIFLKEKWALSIYIAPSTIQLNLKNGKIINTPIYIMTAKTKALLFSKIESRLEQFIEDELIEIFSVPISSMNKNQTEKLINTINKI